MVSRIRNNDKLDSGLKQECDNYIGQIQKSCNELKKERDELDKKVKELKDIEDKILPRSAIHDISIY